MKTEEKLPRDPLFCLITNVLSLGYLYREERLEIDAQL